MFLIIGEPLGFSQVHFKRENVDCPAGARLRSAHGTLKTIDDKLLRIDSSAPEGWVLLGRHCVDCDTVFHPVRYRCPRCGSANLRNADLPMTGKVRTLTLVRRTGPNSMVPAPYHLAIIDLDSGPTIEAISGSDLEHAEIEPGVRVKLVLESIGRDEDGEEIGAYRFALNGDGGPPE